MVDSVKERILKNVVTTCEGITTSNGYAVTIRRVFRIPKTGFEIDTANLPAVIVADVGEEKEELGTNPRVDVTMLLQLTALNYEYHDISEAASELLASIEKALAVDQTRGGLAYDTDITGNALILSEEAIPYGGVSIFVTIRYRHQYKDPYTAI